MTKIAHAVREHDQDNAASKRNDEKLTRTLRATAKDDDRSEREAPARTLRATAKDDSGPEMDINPARTLRATANAGAGVARESAQLAQRATSRIEDATRKLTENSPEFGRALADMLEEQTRQSMDTFSTISRAVNWVEIVQAQSKLMSSSFLRVGQFNIRCSELLFRRMASLPTLPRN